MIYPYYTMKVSLENGKFHAQGSVYTGNVSLFPQLKLYLRIFASTNQRNLHLYFV